MSNSNSYNSNPGYEEDRILNAKPGFPMLILIIGLMIANFFLFLFAINQLVLKFSSAYLFLVIISGILLTILPMLFSGLKIVMPNEARLMTLFGKYKGVIKTPGFYFVNPLMTSFRVKDKNTSGDTEEVEETSGIHLNNYILGAHRISLKTRTWKNRRQKINDEMGNPIEISVAVIWRINCVSKALLNVDNYQQFLSIQCDAALRNIVRSYPYDVSKDGSGLTLRGSSNEISDILQQELQEKVLIAGLEIIDTRITHLAYAPEIAAAMLQRQQASAIIDARQMIVEGAVGMVDMALNKLENGNIVQLDEERKAQMVSNLLVVLCGSKETTPIINSGSLY